METHLADWLKGTPDGVGEVKSGDVMHAWIEKIGDMNVSIA